MQIDLHGYHPREIRVEWRPRGTCGAGLGDGRE